jgi:hypothetical protein
MGFQCEGIRRIGSEKKWALWAVLEGNRKESGWKGSGDRSGDERGGGKGKGEGSTHSMDQGKSIRPKDA